MNNQEAHYARVLEHQAAATAAMGDLSAVLANMVPKVIGQRTYVLDAAGTCQDQYRLPYQSITVDSQSANLLSVFNGPLGESAPNAGPGVGWVRPGGFAVHNLRGYTWSIYGGNQGERVTVTTYARPQAPNGTGIAAAGDSVSTLSNIAGSAASVPLFTAASSVNGRIVFNDSTAVLYLKFGAVASTTSYSVQVAPGGYYEFPTPVYAGEVDGIWSAANGAARLTSW